MNSRNRDSRAMDIIQCREVDVVRCGGDGVEMGWDELGREKVSLCGDFLRLKR